MAAVSKGDDDWIQAQCRPVTGSNPDAANLRLRQICQKCSGTGWREPIDGRDGSYVTSRRCSTCGGTGKLPVDDKQKRYAAWLNATRFRPWEI